MQQETNYYIIGNGGFAKEVFFLASEVLDQEWYFKGFIDYKPEKDTASIGKQAYPVYDEESFLLQHDRKDAVIFFGIGDPIKIEKIAKKFNGFKFPNLIHPSVVYHQPSISLGEGNIIAAGCILTVDIQIGSFNIFNLNTTIGHDAVIGNGNVFNPGVNVSGGVRIGNFNLVGTNATILQYLTLGDNNTLGASCLLTKSVESDTLIVGVPGKKIVKE